jgi:hypothetical protein
MPPVVQPGIRNEVAEHMLTSQRTRYWGRESTCSVLGLFCEELILPYPTACHMAVTSGVHGITLHPRVTCHIAPDKLRKHRDKGQ